MLPVIGRGPEGLRLPDGEDPARSAATGDCKRAVSIF